MWRALLASLVVALALPASGKPARRSARDDCATLEACLAAVRREADTGGRVTKGMERVEARVREFGAASIPGLLGLLRDPDPMVQSFAAEILGGIEGLGPGQLPTLIERARAGVFGLEPAIARIGTPDAITFLVTRLSGEVDYYAPVFQALERLGEQAVPAVVDVFRCKKECDHQQLSHAARVLGELGDRASAAVPALVVIASEPMFALDARREAVAALGALEGRSLTAVTALEALATREPDAFREPVADALASIGGPAGTAVLLERLRDTRDPLILLDLARLGPRGASAGPELRRYLSSEDWELAGGAAQALGEIGDEGATPFLIGQLSRDDDWRIVRAAADSLGRLRAPAAVEALTRTAATHWFPPVVQAAKGALELIGGKPAGADDAFARRLHFLDPGDGVHPNARDCGEQRARSNTRAPEGSELAEVRRTGLTYDAELHAIGADGAVTSRMNQTPTVALKVDDGWLLGADRGEWGGELVHVVPGKAQQTVISENVQAIVRWGGRVVVVTGLAHMATNEGSVYVLRKNDAGHWAATRWRTLPGGPTSARVAADGRLFIPTISGNVLLADDGRIALAGCER